MPHDFIEHILIMHSPTITIIALRLYPPMAPAGLHDIDDMCGSVHPEYQVCEEVHGEEEGV